MLSTFEISKAVDKDGMLIEVDIKYDSGLIQYVFSLGLSLIVGFRFLIACSIPADPLHLNV